MPIDQRRARIDRQLDDRRQCREIGEQFVIRRRPMKSVGIFLGNKAGGKLSGSEPRVLHQRRQEVDIVRHPVDLERIERCHLCIDRRVSGRRVGDQFGDHRVIEHADLAALHHAIVNADERRPNSQVRSS